MTGFYGPKFLKLDEKHWPKSPHLDINNSRDLELKTDTALVCNFATVADDIDPMNSLIKRYSSYDKMLRITA